MVTIPTHTPSMTTAVLQHFITFSIALLTANRRDAGRFGSRSYTLTAYISNFS